MIVLQIILLALATERAVELIVDSKIFDGPRNYIRRWALPDVPYSSTYGRLKLMLDYLVHCGYCVSVWVGGFFALFAPSIFSNTFINWLVLLLVLHGLSNLYHVIFQLIYKGRIWTFDVLTRNDNDDR